MTDSVAVLPWAFAILDSNGDPVSGGTIEFYNAGGLVARTVYSDHSLSTSLGAIVTLSSAGVPINGSSTPVIIYTGTTDYKVIIKNSSGSTLYTFDNIEGALDTSSFLTLANQNVYQRPIDSETSNFTIVAADAGKVMPVNPNGGTFTATLPSAVDVGDGFTVTLRQNGASNQVRILPVSSQTIDVPGKQNVDAYALRGIGHSIEITSDGVNWTITEETLPLGEGLFTIVDRLSTPPGSPDAGARYIITSSPTGAWSSFSEHDIAEADGQGGWIDYTPPTDCGWRAYVQDENTNYQFQDSAWVAKEGYAATSDFIYQLVASTTASADSAISFNDLSTDYAFYELVAHNMLPGTDTVIPHLRVSDDNGSSFKSGASDYNWSFDGLNAATTTDSGDDADTEIQMSGSIGNDVGEGISFKLIIYDPAGTGKTRFTWQLVGNSSTGSTRVLTGGGDYTSEGAIDAFQVFFSTGTVSTGEFKLYGVKAA